MRATRGWSRRPRCSGSGRRRNELLTQPRLKVIGDISCDIEGSIECTVKATEPEEPCFVYNPLTGEARDGCEGDGLVVMAVDILPSELPRDASEDFGRVLKDYIPAIVEADFTAPFEELALPAADQAGGHRPSRRTHPDSRICRYLNRTRFHDRLICDH